MYLYRCLPAFLQLIHASCASLWLTRSQAKSPLSLSWICINTHVPERESTCTCAHARTKISRQRRRSLIYSPRDRTTPLHRVRLVSFVSADSSPSSLSFFESLLLLYRPFFSASFRCVSWVYILYERFESIFIFRAFYRVFDKFSLVIVLWEKSKWWFLYQTAAL